MSDSPTTEIDDQPSMRERVLRAIAAHRTPGYHFPGHLLGVRWPEVGPGHARLVLPLAPHVVDIDGSLDLVALAVFADMALGTAARVRDAHHERQATLELQLQLTGVAARDGVSATARPRDGSGESNDYSLTEATFEAGGNPVAYALGKFARLRAPDGVVLAPLPWQREQVASHAPLDEKHLHPDERNVLERCSAALDRTDEPESLVRRLWGGEGVADRSARRLAIGMHATNRVGHVQGGVLVALAATSATDVAPEGMQLSSVSAWFLRPGVTDLVARSSIVHRGRQTMLVQTDVSGGDGARVLHAIAQFVVPHPISQ
ncbi:MAG TPA: acyl-CoA thioesterase domain-containing protein [Casimicrobiaceae bacterium]